MATLGDELRDKWQPVFVSLGIDPKRIPMDDFDVQTDQIEYTYLLDVDENGWAKFDGRSERRTLPLPIVTEVK